MAGRGRPRSFDRGAALQRAMEVFWEHGYEGTSMADLTAAMGINSPSLYAAFGGKEELFREAVGLYGETAGSMTQRALREEPTACRSIEAMLRANAAAYSSGKGPRGCMIVLAGSTYTTRSASVRDFLIERRQETVVWVWERLERGVAEGDLSGAADTALIADFYTTVLYGLSIRARDGAGAEELNKIIDGAMAAWPALAGTSTAPTS